MKIINKKLLEDATRRTRIRAKDNLAMLFIS
jgi:hypothetical protein